MKLNLVPIQVNIKQAFNNIRQHFLRSFLTLLGVLVGTAAVVSLLTGSELATRSALEQFKKLGVDLIGVSFSSDSEDQHSQAELDLNTLEKFRSPNIDYGSAYNLHYSEVIFRASQVELNVIGATQKMQHLLNLTPLAGRFISNLDNQNSYCVLGFEAAQSLNNNPATLLGEQIRINNFYFTVIGILDKADKNLFLLADPNESIIIPLSNSLQLFKNAQINHVIYKTRGQQDIEAIQNEIQSYFAKARPNLQISFRSPETIVENMTKQNRTFKLLLGFIGSISLIVGGIGVMNIMLVSVTERRREIGIRMAVGANQQDILYLFLAEAAILTLLGGLAGIILGEFISIITAKISQWPFHLLPTPIFIGFFVSTLVGLFFGFYPARRASLLDPIEILRTV
jgi:putative ABC transport system permease protein